MLVTISLRDGSKVRVESFTELKISNKGSYVIEAENLNDVSLNDEATYTFFGKNTVVLFGKDILYLEFK